MILATASVAQSKAGLPSLTIVWTEQEKTEFKNCVARISDSSRENALQLSADVNACAFFEEEQHWLNLHPKAIGRKKNEAKNGKCLDRHPLPRNGTPQEIDAAFDFCLCKAYGLHTK